MTCLPNGKKTNKNRGNAGEERAHRVPDMGEEIVHETDAVGSVIESLWDGI